MAVRRDILVLRASVLEVSQGHLARHSPKLLTELFTVKVEILSRARVKVYMYFFPLQSLYRRVSRLMIKWARLMRRYLMLSC